MMSDDNDTIVDTDYDQSEAETDHNHTYVDIMAFGLENAPDPYYNQECE